jgi:CHAD domain-containing protein/predicted phosphodiesterase
MPTTDLLARQAMAAYGGRALVQQLEALREQLSILAAGDDEEAVHQSRVASRRLRSCLDVFGPALGATGEWHREARKVTKALGEARDLDVQIGTLRRYVESGDGTLAALLEEMRTRRLGMNKGVRKAAVRFLDSRAARRMAGCAEAGEARPLSQARAHVLHRLDELQALQSCLEDEKEVEKHHAMRIAAKRLRYTMEIFRPLYNEVFSTTLPTIKSLQEALGEVHDRDVWIASLGGVKGGEGFQAQMQRERREWFSRAQTVWREAREDELPGRLRALNDAAEATWAGGLTALLADVHGNLPALRAVLRDAVREGADRALCAGDVVGLGPYPDECIVLLRGAAISCVKGNFDEATADYLLRGEGKFQNHAALASIAGLEKNSLVWLDALPPHLQTGSLAMYHASPWSLREKVEMAATDTVLDRVVRESSGSIIVLGHTHEQMVLGHGGALIINPGSVGRQGDGDPRARYALLDGEGGVRLRVVAYPEEETAAEADACGFPAALGEMFRRGIALDAAVKALRDEEERAKEARLVGLVDACRAYASAQQGWPDHPERVRVIALLLFEAVNDKALGMEERTLLECAALLHDIGVNCGLKGHHRESMRMILKSDIPFHAEERRMVAVVARYHRRSLPRRGHAHYEDMSGGERRIARKLAALLRAADGVDRAGEADWSVEVRPDAVVLRSAGTHPMTLDPDKTSLFTMEFAKELKIA